MARIIRKISLLAYAVSDGLDQPVHPHSLIKTFTALLQNDSILQNVLKQGNDHDVTVHMPRLISHMLEDGFSLIYRYVIPFTLYLLRY